MPVRALGIGADNRLLYLRVLQHTAQPSLLAEGRRAHARRGQQPRAGRQRKRGQQGVASWSAVRATVLCSQAPIQGLLSGATRHALIPRSRSQIASPTFVHTSSQSRSPVTLSRHSNKRRLAPVGALDIRLLMPAEAGHKHCTSTELQTWMCITAVDPHMQWLF